MEKFKTQCLSGKRLNTRLRHYIIIYYVILCKQIIEEPIRIGSVLSADIRQGLRENNIFNIFTMCVNDMVDSL